MPIRVLILGGTGEARELAAVLTADGVAVTSSLAGRTAAPAPLAGAVRVGGFGGAEGLATWLRAEATTAVVDATHPFAGRVSAAAVTGCALAGVPLVRLARPGFTAEPGDRWTWVGDLEGAAAAVDALGTRVLLSTGRQGLAAFANVRAWALVRAVQAPAPPLPAACTVLLARGPFTLAGERALLAEHAIDLVVTKDSGGSATAPKLVAARERGLPVVIVGRPPEQECAATVPGVAEAAAWVMMRR